MKMWGQPPEPTFARTTTTEDAPPLQNKQRWGILNYDCSGKDGPTPSVLIQTTPEILGRSISKHPKVNA